MHLESRRLAPGTINLRLEAVRRLAFEAADCGLLSADWAAGKRRVKRVKKLGVRHGNWLTAQPGPSSPAGSRSRPGQGQTGTGLACSASCLWAPSPRTRRADRAHAGSDTAGHFHARVRGSSSGDGADGRCVAHSVTQEAVQVSAEQLKRCARNAGTSSRFCADIGAPVPCRPLWNLISLTGCMA